MGSRECVDAYIVGNLEEVNENGVPENLLDLYRESFNRERYQDDKYPKNRAGNMFIRDSVGCHTVRCRAWVEVMELPEGVNRQILGLTVTLHDLTENGPKDTTSVAKMEHPELAVVTAAEEMATAEKRFTPDQLVLYKKGFEGAKHFLEHGEGQGFSNEGVGARLIEQSDGNMVFHYLWSRWVLSEDYDANYQMPELAANFTFIKTELFKRSLANYSDKEVKKWGLEILRRQIDYVKGCWQEVKDSCPDRMPAQLVWLGMDD